MTKLKQLFLKMLPAGLILALSGLRYVLDGRILRLQRQVSDQRRQSQMAAKRLMTGYANLSAWDQSKPATLEPYELGIYSQNGEDGILLHLFSVIGSHDQRFVEFGIGDGRQCNTANLSLNFGWQGLLMEADPRMAEKAAYFYRQELGPYAGNVQVLQQKITPDNINQILAGNGFHGEIDLLSIDIDGNDYWVWEAITVIQPRIVVIEYNASLGDSRSIATLYDENFDQRRQHPSGFYHGASLAALARLGDQKGYLLAGCESAGVNAFLLRRDVAMGKLAEVPVTAAYRPHYQRTTHLSPEMQWRQVQHMPFREV